MPEPIFTAPALNAFAQDVLSRLGALEAGGGGGASGGGLLGVAESTTSGVTGTGPTAVPNLACLFDAPESGDVLVVVEASIRNSTAVSPALVLRIDGATVETRLLNIEDDPDGWASSRQGFLVESLASGEHEVTLQIKDSDAEGVVVLTSDGTKPTRIEVWDATTPA